MARMNELLTALGIRARLLNRYAFQTKGQMARGCADYEFLGSLCQGDDVLLLARQDALCEGRIAAPTRSTAATASHVSFVERRCSRAASTMRPPTNCPTCCAQVIDTEKAEGSHIRSFQLAISRLRHKPERARFDIHRPGPLSDHPGELQAYTDVYVAGLEEVARLLDGVRAEPL